MAHAAMMRWPLHQHRAGATLAAVAAFLGGRQLHGFTPGIEQGHPGFKQQIVQLAVDAKLKRCGRRKRG
jgi:hypothetical protein